MRKNLNYNFSVLSLAWDCGADWAAFNQSCFKLVLNYSDIEECRQDCMVGGGDLASIHSKEENIFLQTLMGDNLVWFGGRITERDGEFSWIDGSDWDFAYWDESKELIFQIVYF